MLRTEFCCTQIYDGVMCGASSLGVGAAPGQCLALHLALCLPASHSWKLCCFIPWCLSAFLAPASPSRDNYSSSIPFYPVFAWGGVGSSKDEVKPPLSADPPQPQSPAEGQEKTFLATGSPVLRLLTSALLVPGLATLCRQLLSLSGGHLWGVCSKETQQRFSPWGSQHPEGSLTHPWPLISWGL